MAECHDHLECPNCALDTHVLDSRSSPDRIRRRRECKHCGHRFTTAERIVERDAPVSATSAILIGLIEQRDVVGLAKYGVTLGRKDLSVVDWLQHMTEELLDGAGYAQAAIRKLREGGHAD